MLRWHSGRDPPGSSADGRDITRMGFWRTTRTTSSGTPAGNKPLTKLGDQASLLERRVV
jgi:hypothetical protein